MMHAQDVLDITRCLDTAGIPVWLDGGWGIDALVGEQRRPHADLDVVIALHDVRNAQDALQQRGFVLRDETDRRIDFHTVTFDAGGGGIQQFQDGSCFRYPPEGFNGRGRVNARTVRCLTAEVQMLCHVGYTPDADDYHDVLLLQTRFGIELLPPSQWYPS